DFEGFGEFLALSGETVIVGMRDAMPGLNREPYVFARLGPAWEQVGRLPLDAPYETAAASVAIDGETALVGTPAYSGGGVVHVFAREAGQWNPQAILQPDDAVDGH